MLQKYHSELGGTAKFKNTARYNPFIRKWTVRTHDELKGQGIQFFEKACNGTNRNIYYVTDKTF